MISETVELTTEQAIMEAAEELFLLKTDMPETSTIGHCP